MYPGHFLDELYSPKVRKTPNRVPLVPLKTTEKGLFLTFGEQCLLVVKAVSALFIFNCQIQADACTQLPDHPFPLATHLSMSLVCSRESLRSRTNSGGNGD